MIDHIDQARDALQFVPANCDRETWLRLGMSFKEAGGTFDDFHNWSKQGDNYKDEKDVRSMWDSIKPDGGVTRRSLFKHAAEHGYRLRSNGVAPQNKSLPARVVTSRNARNSSSATEIWVRCEEATEAHSYISAKQGVPDGLRVVQTDDALTIRGESMAGWLAVPVMGATGELASLQFIAPAVFATQLKERQVPGKLNLPGAPMAGTFVVGELEPEGTAYLVEGIGTAWACRKATGRPAVVCFGWGMVKARASELRARYPTAGLVIVPDVGKEADAERIAREVGASVAAMPEGWAANSDVSDLALRDGIDAARSVLANARVPAAPEPRYKLLTSADLHLLPALSWRIRSTLPAEGLAAIFGPSGSGKSFLALDMAAAIASGRSWFGLRVTAAPVVYCMLEGEAGLPVRVAAWEARNNSQMQVRMVVQPFKLTEPQDVQDLATAVLGAGGGAVTFLDTLNRAAPTADENSSRDMGSIIEAAKVLQRATGGLVVLVHHTGKDVSKGLRGHSSLFAALDAAIEVSRSMDRHEWTLTKSKDGADGVVNAFMLNTVLLGTDSDGEQLSSCAVIQDHSATEVKRTKLPQGKNQRIVWEALKPLFKEGTMGKPGAPPYRHSIELEDAIACASRRLTCASERRGERAREAITGLVSHGLIGCNEGWIWTTT